EEFGLGRLRAILKATVRQPGIEIGRAIVDELHRFVNPEPLDDDICLVTVEITAASPVSQPLAATTEAGV
ncbi:MAG: hypothetical protein ABIZ56_04295, partial [Chthoniobacteraceae bacterium]